MNLNHMERKEMSKLSGFKTGQYAKVNFKTEYMKEPETIEGIIRIDGDEFWFDHWANQSAIESEIISIDRPVFKKERSHE